MTGRKNNPPVDRMTWGIHNEFRGVAAAEAELGYFFTETGEAQRSHFLDCGGFQLRATPDGRVATVQGGIGLEIKCPEKLHDNVRPYIACQAQIQALVCDFDEVLVVEWTFDGYKGWRVLASSAYIDFAIPLLREFCTFLSLDKEPPRLRKRPEPPPVLAELIFEGTQKLNPQLDNPF